MLQGTAHRAGLPGLQGLRQDSRLAVQKGAVHRLIPLPQPVGLPGRRPVRLPGLPILLPALLLLPQLPLQSLQLPLPLQLPLQLAGKLHFLRIGPLQGLDFFLQVSQGRPQLSLPEPKSLASALPVGPGLLQLPPIPAAFQPGGGIPVQLPQSLPLRLQLAFLPVQALQLLPSVLQPFPLPLQIFQERLCAAGAGPARFLLPPLSRKPVLRPGDIQAQLLQPPVAGQLRLQGCRRSLQLPLFRLPPGLPLKPLPAACKLLCRRPPLFLLPGQQIPQPFQLRRLSQERFHLLQLSPQFRVPAFRLPLCQKILLQHLFQKGADLLHREFPRGLLRLGPADPIHVLGNPRLLPLAQAPQPSRLLPQLLLERPVIPGFKDFPKNGLPLPGVRQDQLHKIPLGDHGDLGKLVSVQSQDLPHPLVHVLQPGHRPAVGEDKLRLRPLQGGSASPLGRPLILWIPADGVNLIPAGKGQFHLRRHRWLRIFGAQHHRLPVLPAGLPVEGEGDGVKNGGFPRPRVPGDEVEPALPQLCHIQLHLPGIGAEGGNSQSHRLHLSSPQIFSIIVCTSSLWPALIP